MGKISSKLRSLQDGGLAFWCPGCEEMHPVYTGAGAGPRWGFNGNPDAPTFTPSVLVRGGHYAPGHDGGDCWCNFEARTGRKSDFKCRVCHTFVTDGQIQFLTDCTHALAGQTVPMPDFPEDER